MAILYAVGRVYLEEDRGKMSRFGWFIDLIPFMYFGH